jgi:UDP-glucose 4-epimerase
MTRTIEEKRILITGGTGSLGKVLLRRILSGKEGNAKKIVIFSRDEAKQHELRVQYMKKTAPTDEIIYRGFQEKLEFRIGDVRDPRSLAGALSNIDVVVNAAALKQVPSCEYFPVEATLTNIMGAANITQLIRDLRLPVETVIGISTDKAVQPVNVMGMTKAIQERIFLSANLDTPDTRYVLVRYGNVLASRGSAIPLFSEQIRNGGPVTITDERMTRFLLSLEDAVDTVMTAYRGGRRGETFIPIVPAANMVDVADAMIDGRDIAKTVSGIRPGEKLYESLVSEEESVRTTRRGDYYVIEPILPELREATDAEYLNKPYTSVEDVMDANSVKALLKKHDLLRVDNVHLDGEFLR